MYHFLCGILRFIRKQDPLALNILDQRDGQLRELQGTRESVFTQVHQSDIGANPKRAAAISKEEEIAFGR